jgi:hypothetical protein
VTKHLKSSWAPVVHGCNHTYSGGRDQDDYSLKSVSGKYFVRPYLKITQHNKRADAVAHPEFKPQYYQKKKKKKKKIYLGS